MLLDRAESMYQRDKNHPAILIWSCGNESYGGKDIWEMSQFFRREDPTRLVHYEGVFHDRSYNDTSDMESQMYPSVESIKALSGEGPEQTVPLLRVHPRHGELLRSDAQVYGSDGHGNRCTRAGLSGIISTRQ